MSEVLQIFTGYWHLPLELIDMDMRRQAIRAHINKVLRASDWTDLPNSGLTLSEQIDQQKIRVAWMELDDPNLDPDTLVLPQYPMMDRL